MISGHVSPIREAEIELRIIGPSGDSVVVNAIVDTGFTEYLTLPESLAHRLGFQFLDSDKMILANESIVPVDIYAGTVEWDGIQREITIDVSPKSAILVGMRMMYGRKLFIHVVDGGEVRIESN